MQRKLSKQWGPYAAGTVVVDNLTDAGASPGSIQVNAERFAVLDETGYFEPAEPVRPIPEEVRTAEDLFPDFADAGTSGFAARRAKTSDVFNGERVRPEMVKIDAGGVPQTDPPPGEPASAPPDLGEPAKKEP